MRWQVPSEIWKYDKILTVYDILKFDKIQRFDKIW